MPTSVLGVALLLFPILPSPGRAQSAFVVQGRVVEAGGPGIQNAIVQLDGSRPILTSSEGSFRFEGVAGGERTLRVEAFGYLPFAGALAVAGDTAVTVVLDIAPFALDSLVVAPRRIDMDGRVRGFERDVPISGADVVSSHGQVTRTNGRGGFGLDVWEGVSLLLRVRAFGYLPLDTILSPEEHQDYLFFVEPDPLVERMIATEIRRIEERAGGRLAVTMPPLNRDDLLRWEGASLRDVLRYEHPLKLDRIRCVIVDEKALTPSMAAGVLMTTLAQDVERIEFLFRGAMLRVYTREFMRTMLGSGIELRSPGYVEWARPPFCT